MRVIFMGTPDFAAPTLQALIDSDHDVAAVYTAPPRPANRGKKVTKSAIHTLAESSNLNTLTPTSLKSDEAQNIFRSHEADIAVVVAYGLLLPQAILDACPHGCINVHPSALPRWRGAAPIQRSIMAGDTTTSICIMQMDAGLDTGGILLEEPYTIPDGTTSKELEQQLASKAAPMVLDTIKGLAQNTLIAIQQSEEGVTYAAKISKEECALNFNEPADALRHHIHGLSPFPGAYFIHEGERVKLLKVTLIGTDNSELPSTVLDEQLTIQCTHDAIRPQLLQRQGKTPMQAEECLRGLHIPKGTCLY